MAILVFRSSRSPSSGQTRSCCHRESGLTLDRGRRTQFVENEAKAPNIALEAVSSTLDALRTHVAARPHRSLREIHLLRQLARDTEVRQFKLSLRVEKDVGWLDIPMQLVFGVQITEPTQHLKRYLRQHTLIDFRCDFGCPKERDDVLKRACVHEFEDDFDLALVEICAV